MITGRDEEFDEFFAEFIAEAVRAATRVLTDRVASEDAAIEAMARAHVRWARLHDDPNRRAWVLRVTINKALDIQRSDRSRRDRESRSGASATTPGFEQASVDRMALNQALCRLPRRQLQAVSLRYLADLPEADAAAAMSISVGSLKVHVRRGLSALGGPLAREITGGACDVDV